MRGIHTPVLVRVRAHSPDRSDLAGRLDFLFGESAGEKSRARPTSEIIDNRAYLRRAAPAAAASFARPLTIAFYVPSCMYIITDTRLMRGEPS